MNEDEDNSPAVPEVDVVLNNKSQSDKSENTCSAAKNQAKVWRHYSRSRSGEAQCNHCSKCIKLSCGNTSGMLRHLKRKHTAKYSAMMGEPSSTTAKKSSKELAQKTLTQFQFKPCNARLQPSDPRAKRLTRSIGELIALTHSPYYLVNNIGFTNLMKEAEPAYTVPCRTTFSRSVIPGIYKEIKSEIQAKFRYAKESGELKALALTTDMWTSRNNEAYISLTIHSILSNDLKLERLTIANSPFPGVHTGQTIYEKLTALLSEEEWNIPTGVRMFIVTDNAANLRNAIRLTNWESVPCLAHTLQLALVDCKKEHPSIQTMLNKARAIVGHYARSPTAEERRIKYQAELKPLVPEHCLIQDVATRWNSEYLMLNRLVEQETNVTAELATSRSNIPNLTGHEWLIAESLVTILKPLYEATVDLCSEQYPTISMAIPILMGINATLAARIPTVGQQMTNSNMTCTEFSRSLIKALKSRFCTTMTDKLFVLAMLLDPRFRDILLSNEEKIVARMTFIKALKEDVTQDQHQVEENLNGSQNQSGPSTSSDLWSYYDRMKELVTNQPINVETLETEMNRYLKLPVISREKSPLQWWSGNKHLFPNLFALVPIYLCIPATQVSSERVFSCAGNIVTAKREYLNPEHVEQLTFIHENLITKYFPK